MMHRALYANIVGEEALVSFAHGCTVKQYDGRDYIVDHVTRLAKPVSSFPTMPVVSAAEIDAQHKYLYELKDQLDMLRPKVRAIEAEVKESHRKESRLDVQIRKLRPPVAKSTNIKSHRHVAKTVPASETHLVSLVAQVLRIGDHSKARTLTSQQLKTLRASAPSLANYFFRWKNGTIVWGQPLHRTTPKSK